MPKGFGNGFTISSLVRLLPGLVAIALSALAAVPRFWWWQEIIKAWWPLLLILDLILLPVFGAFKGVTRKVIAPLLVLLIIALWARGGPIKYKHRDGNYTTIKVLFHMGLLDIEPGVRMPDADVVVAQNERAIDSFFSGYPFSASADEGIGAGFVMYSRFPAELSLKTIGDDMPPVLAAAVQLPGGENVSIGMFRLYKPQRKNDVAKNNIIIRRFGTVLRWDMRPAIVAGFMQSPPGSHSYRIFSHVSETRPQTWRWDLGIMPLLRMLFDSSENLHVFAKKGATYEEEGRRCNELGCTIWGSARFEQQEPGTAKEES